METILLGDYVGDSDIRDVLYHQYQLTMEELEKYDILAAGYWTGDYEGSGWVLVRNRVTKQLMEVHGAHCSCYGLEGQWEPTPTTVAYLTAPQFHVRDLSPEMKARIQMYVSENFFDL